MKKLSLGLLAAVLTLSFASCSIDEIAIEAPQDPLLESYELKKDAQGMYSIDFDVIDKTEAAIFKNENSLTHEILLSKVGYDTKNQYSNDLELDNDKLNLGFIDGDTGKKINLTIEDENITFAKSKTTRYLKSYGLTKNVDGSYQLDFQVHKNVSTSFVYNEDLERYEVHLVKGDSTNKVFTRTMKLSDAGRLRITFVNHFLLGKGLAEMTTDKPDIIVVEEN